jgi:hypothetical protein
MKTNNQAGLIKNIILIIIAIAILSYLGINLKDVWQFLVGVWENLLETPFKILWDLWIEHIWTPFLNSINSLNS